jgi:hypothetical protein
MRRLLARLLAPALRALARLHSPGDPWERVPYRVPIHAFGAGNRHEFTWYLEGESRVEVASLDDVQDWLLGCEYVHDSEMFRESDFWQHPLTFERTRQGDCEDHALWAWRKLIELGTDVELVSGRTLRSDGSTGGGHVWLLLRENGLTFVLETTSKSKRGMVRPLAEVRDRYLPSFGVDRQGMRFAYNGYLIEFGKKPRGQPSRRTA